MLLVSRGRTHASGASAQSAGNDAQWPGHRGAAGGKKRSGATAGSNESSTDRSQNADNGIVRLSRAAVVLAVKIRMRKIHVLSDERARKRSRPRSTPSHASWTTSRATAGSPT